MTAERVLTVALLLVIALLLLAGVYVGEVGGIGFGQLVTIR